MAKFSRVVRWDATSMRDVDPDILRSQIAVIAQEYTHWPMTARQNITMGRAGTDDTALLRAARDSGANEVIADLAQGYDTLLDRRFERGTELSGGQWQLRLPKISSVQFRRHVVRV